AGDGDLGSLSTVVLMPSGNGVLAGRQVREFEVASTLAYVVVIGLEHRELAVHPGMDVALYRNEFRFVVFCRDGRRARRLRFVPLGVDFGQGVNVVRCLIA